jgi:hypothetical protein
LPCTRQFDTTDEAPAKNTPPPSFALLVNTEEFIRTPLSISTPPPTVYPAVP